MGSLAYGQGMLWERALQVCKQNETLLENLREKTVVVTGATGLIGSQLIRTLLCANGSWGLGIKPVLLVRNIEKASKLFCDAPEVECLEWSLGNVVDLKAKADVFVHAACTTESRVFFERPLETLKGTIDGTSSCLQMAEAAGVSAFIFLSSMEVYGEPTRFPAAEADMGCLDSANTRNSYPIGKLASESMVISYGVEQETRTVVLRLTQTFGSGVKPDDSRVFAEFARCAVQGEDIVLFSDGAKQNCYLSVDDAISSILLAAANNNARGIYNVANPDTFCSIREMAEMVLNEFGADGARVVFGIDEARANSFRVGGCIQLDISKIQALGWSPTGSLLEMYEDLLAFWRESS